MYFSLLECASRASDMLFLRDNDKKLFCVCGHGSDHDRFYRNFARRLSGAKSTSSSLMGTITLTFSNRRPI